MQLLLENGSYFHPQLMEMKSFDRIHVKDQLIHCIDSDHPVQGDFDEIDCSGQYIIPGLIDGHIHFFQSAGLYTRPDGLDLRNIKPYEDEISQIRASFDSLFRRYLACGVTGVIDDGGPFWNKEVADMANASDLAPHVAWAGPLVSTVSREKLDLGDPPIIKAEDSDHARELVKNCIQANPDFVKFWFIYQEESFDDDSAIMHAGIGEARSQNIPVMVHATELETAKRAVQYGASILVHSVFDSDIDQEFIDLLLENEVTYIPTLMVRKGYQQVYRTRLDVSPFEQAWGDPAAFESFRDLMTIDEEDIPESHRPLRNQYEGDLEDLTTFAFPNLRRLARAGVTIVTGTDAGNVGTLHGPSLHEEMAFMVAAGMDQAAVLQATTSNAARLLGKETGEIAENMVADLVILEQNPLDDIVNTREIDQVIYQGNLYYPTELIDPVFPHDVVDRQLDAYNNRSIDDFLAPYHPRVEIYDLKTNKILMEGLDDMRKRYTTLFESSPDLHVELQNRIVEGNMVIDHEEVMGFEGDRVVHAVAIYEVENQLITRVWFTR